MQFIKQKIQLYGILLAGVFFLLMTTQLKAQNYRPSPLNWGLKAGINATDMYGDDIDGTSAIASFSGGAWFNYRFTNFLSIQPEVLFTTKGADINTGVLDETIVDEPGTAEYRFGYLEVPVLAKLHIATRRKLQPNLYVGPAFGFNLYGDANDIEIDDEMTEVDISMVFGSGLNFKIAQSQTDFIQKVGLDLRYSLGLTNAFDTIGDPDARNGVFTAAISVGF